jgi:hypothetical protein
MIRVTLGSAFLAAAVLVASAGVAHAQMQTSKPFAGAKVNGGTVTLSMKDGKHALTLSSDFKVPDTPDPHWQIVDAGGRTYLLQRLGVKSLGGLATDRINMSIVLPDDIRNVAKVQIYCSWAEAVLGEAAFPNPQITLSR